MMRILNSARQFLLDIREATGLPRVRICLMADAALTNDPFYLRCVKDQYRDATRRHPKFPLIRNSEIGVAVCVLPEDHEAYLRIIEGAARRNIKKAQRLGYQFSRIEPNDWLENIRDIHLSTDVRQGPVREDVLKGPTAISDPPSNSNLHDYPYFGVIKEGRCAAYASCLVAGEMISIGNIFGHADFMSDGVVPLLISEIVQYTKQKYPKVRYFVYDKYYGAGETARRFKKKFGFLPHRVKWAL
jgi:hypothetical protein